MQRREIETLTDRDVHQLNDLNSRLDAITALVQTVAMMQRSETFAHRAHHQMDKLLARMENISTRKQRAVRCGHISGSELLSQRYEITKGVLFMYRHYLLQQTDAMIAILAQQGAQVGMNSGQFEVDFDQVEEDVFPTVERDLHAQVETQTVRLSFDDLELLEDEEGDVEVQEDYFPELNSTLCLTHWRHYAPTRLI